MKHEIGVDLANFYQERKEIEDKLLPCPFCGGEDIEFSLIHPSHNGKPDMSYWCYWEILCPDCGANFEEGVVTGRQTPDVWEKAKQNIIKAWNTRIKN